jgi:hypothetical protein
MEGRISLSSTNPGITAITSLAERSSVSPKRLRILLCGGIGSSVVRFDRGFFGREVTCLLIDKLAITTTSGTGLLLSQNHPLPGYTSPTLHIGKLIVIYGSCFTPGSIRAPLLRVFRIPPVRLRT